jgi:hypothetical protein
VDVLILAKAPVAGRVKTRLCPPCTPHEAAAVAEAALADTLASALACGADRVLLALDGEPGPWLPAGIDVVDQGEGTLTERLATAWRSARGPTVQVGMDTPQVGAVDLAAALARLDHVDAVFGHALDGGWWTLGMRTPRPDVFAGIPTSRADTGRRQLARLRRIGLEVEVLADRRDVDTWPDAVIVAAEVPSSRFAAAVAAVGAVSR